VCAAVRTDLPTRRLRLRPRRAAPMMSRRRCGAGSCRVLSSLAGLHSDLERRRGVRCLGPRTTSASCATMKSTGSGAARVVSAARGFARLGS